MACPTPSGSRPAFRSVPLDFLGHERDHRIPSRLFSTSRSRWVPGFGSASPPRIPAPPSPPGPTQAGRLKARQTPTVFVWACRGRVLGIRGSDDPVSRDDADVAGLVGARENDVLLQPKVSMSIPCNRATPIPTGSSTIWGQTGSIRSTNCRSRVDSPTGSTRLPTPSRTTRSAGSSRSCPARGRRVAKTIPECPAITPVFPATPTSLTGTSTRSTNFATAAFPAASPMKSIYTSTRGGPRLSREAVRRLCRRGRPRRLGWRRRRLRGGRRHRYPVGWVPGQHAPVPAANGVRPVRRDAGNQRRPAAPRFAPSQRAWVLSGFPCARRPRRSRLRRARQ